MGGWWCQDVRLVAGDGVGGGGVIVVKYLLDDTVKTEEDVKKYLGLNTLASLPDTKEAKRRKR